MEAVCLWFGRIALVLGGVIILAALFLWATERIIRITRTYKLIIEYIYNRKALKQFLEERDIEDASRKAVTVEAWLECWTSDRMLDSEVLVTYPPANPKLFSRLPCHIVDSVNVRDNKVKVRVFRHGDQSIAIMPSGGWVRIQEKHLSMNP